MKTVKLAKVSDLSHDEWLELRRTGISGSDVGAICGVNPYQSPLTTYMDKLGLYTKNVDNEAMKAGRKLEPVLADWFTEETGLRVQKSNFMYRHPEHEWALGNVDRIITHPLKGKGILEIKTASEYMKDEWAGDEPPNHYRLQLMWYLFVTGLSYGAFAVLIGGNKFRYFFVDRDDELLADVFDIAKNFWFNNVLVQQPPEIDGSNATTEMYKLMHPQSEDVPIELPSDAVRWAGLVEHYKAEKKATEEKLREYENKIKDSMKEAETAFAGRHKITWKTDSRGVRPLKIKLNAVME